MHEKTSPAEQKRAFDLIWSQMPHMQNRMSSSWWFFLLLPKGEEGYGPKQIMFAITARAGEDINISGGDLRGIDLQRSMSAQQDQFEVQNVGWYFDGEMLHEELVKQIALATLSSDGYIDAWAKQPGGGKYGSKIWASESEPLTLEAHFKGARGEARFKTWGDLKTVDTSPDESINISTPFGGTHFIAWRLVNFEGTFTSPVGTEQLSGLGYFQRVCLNVPAFPWKWVWALLEDGTLISAFVPYIGPHLFRRDYSFYDSKRWERLTIPIGSGAFIDFPGDSERILFDKSRVRPVFKNGSHPDFLISAQSKNGDFIKFLARSYDHAPQTLSRKIFGGNLRTHWSYNEYMFRMEGLQGQVNGQMVNHQTRGNGFGNVEYTWGLGL